MSMIVRMIKFFIRYVTSSLLVLLVYPFTNRGFFQQSYNRVLLFFSNIHPAELSDIFPKLKESALNLIFNRFSRKAGNVSYGEIQALCMFTAYLKAKNVFEIGTCDGGPPSVRH